MRILQYCNQHILAIQCSGSCKPLNPVARCQDSLGMQQSRHAVVKACSSLGMQQQSRHAVVHRHMQLRSGWQRAAVALAAMAPREENAWQILQILLNSFFANILTNSTTTYSKLHCIILFKSYFFKINKIRFLEKMVSSK